MPYFYNNSETTTAVEVGNGEVLSVFPKATVFINASASSRREVRKMISQGVLQRTGNPKRLTKSLTDVLVVSPREEDLSTSFSNAMIESSESLEADIGSVQDATEEIGSKPQKRQTRRSKKQD